MVDYVVKSLDLNRNCDRCFYIIDGKGKRKRNGKDDKTHANGYVNWKSLVHGSVVVVQEKKRKERIK